MPAGAEAGERRSIDLILEAAAECFRQRGFAATSIDDVARHLGATKGMIYHHFRSKNDLFFAVYRRGMDFNFAETEPHFHGDGTALDRLARMGLAHAINIMARQSWARVQTEGVTMHLRGATTAEQRATLNQLVTMRDRFEAMFREIIEEVLPAGELPSSLAVKSFLSVLNGTIVWYTPRADDPQHERRQIAESLVAYAINGLGVKPPDLTAIDLGDTK